MSKNKITFIVLIVLISLSLYYFLTQKESTIKKDLSDFAVEDTASITKIFMADKLNRQVTLTREGKHWMANGKYIVRKDAISVLLTTIKDIKVKSPVPKATLDLQIKHLAAKSVKVEIYTGSEKPHKVYYVGGATLDNQGTYMLLKNSAKPFVMYLPGFFGYLSTRYFTEAKLWRDNSIFNSEFNEIKSVTLEYPKANEKNIVVSNLGNNSFEVKSLLNNEIVQNYDTFKVKKFLSAFIHFGYEAPVVEMKPEKRDSLLNVLPENIYTVELTNGQKKSLKLFNVRVSKQEMEKYKRASEFDPDRMYGFYNNDKEIVTVQTQFIYPLIKEFGDFAR